MNFTVISLFALLCAGVFAAETPAIPTAHTTRNLEGWTVRVDDRLLKGDGAALGERALKLLTARLVAITVVVPEKALTKLRSITIELDLDYGGLRSMQYHPNAGWLKEHGYSEALAKCVHLPEAEDFLSPYENHRMPWVVLHELAHAYHDQVLSFDEPRIHAAWKTFHDSGKYKSVLTSPGHLREHYGMTDAKEFFAEMTECYFGSNDFYPFVTGELKQAEPEIFGLLAEIWGPLPERSKPKSATKPSNPLTLSSPLNYQIVQRRTKDLGRIVIEGELAAMDGDASGLEARIIADGRNGEWTPLAPANPGSSFRATLDVPAGGWYRLEVRVARGGKSLADAGVEHVGVGEVFVVTGQSNSANHGDEKQTSKTGKVATFDGQHWQLSNDPQPGASGGGGSFMPPFGDAMAMQFHVPVGFIACGIGATSVREWLPKGSTFPNPPTLVSQVQQLPSGEWESKGQAFDRLVTRMKKMGPHGFRAVLWHQGESDANQKDPTRTLPGNLYREYLEKILRESRREIGWDTPWFVAQVSYHVPGDEASEDIRTAQASLWKDGIAFQGPDTDALKGEWRDGGGKGVHFSGPGLREHAARWVEKIAPWLEQQWK